MQNNIYYLTQDVVRRPASCCPKGVRKTAVDLSLSMLGFLIMYFGFCKKRGFACSVKYGTFYMLIVLMLAFTVMPFGVYTGGINRNFLETVNLIPYRDIMAHYLGAVRDTVGNILLFVPFGVALPAFFGKSTVKTVLISAAFSLTIESYQLLGVLLCFPNARAFDITDIINNTLGALLGAAVFSVISNRIVKRKR